MTSTVTPLLPLHTSLSAGLSNMQLTLSQSQQQQLLDYVALLDKWNKTYNLTAVREPARMVGLHLFDSLAVLPHLGHAKTILDVGTGAGLPGIPLSIARPELRVTMLDTIAKKTTFVRQAIGELKLTNAEVLTDRVENVRIAGGFDIVISRAFAELKDFIEGAAHLLAPGARMLAMKGVHPHDEIARLPAGFAVTSITPLNVPDVEGQRHLVVIQKSETP